MGVCATILLRASRFRTSIRGLLGAILSALVGMFIHVNPLTRAAVYPGSLSSFLIIIDTWFRLQLKE